MSAMRLCALLCYATFLEMIWRSKKISISSIVKVLTYSSSKYFSAALSYFSKKREENERRMSSDMNDDS